MTSSPKPPLPLHELAERLATTFTGMLASPDVDMTRVLLKAAEASRPQKPCLRMSYGADCRLQRWLEEHKPEVFRPFEAATLLKFAGGHVWEAAFLQMARRALRESTLGELGYDLDPSWEQRELRHPEFPEKIKGHPDGAIVWSPGEGWERVPVAIWDAKRVAAWGWKRWEEGRLPDPTWGYRHQAANYLEAAAAEGHEFDGFIWIVGLERNGGVSEVVCGYAYREELREYAADAAEGYRAAVAKDPPPPCNPERNAVPCRSGGTIYCRAYEYCSQHH